MRNSDGIRVLCTLALLAGATALKAQTPSTTDPAITPLSVMGVVSEFKADARQVIVTTAAGSIVTVTLSDRTVFMRIPPGEKTKDKFIKIAPTDFTLGGDQLRALGTKSTDGGRFTPEEIVTGSFQTISGNVTEIDAEKKEIKIKDLQSQQPTTIALSKDSSMRRLTPEMIAALTTPAKASGDLQEMFDQLPAFTLQDLKPGDSILISSTKGADATRITAIAIVSGVGPLLQNKQTGRATAVSLGAMSLGAP